MKEGHSGDLKLKRHSSPVMPFPLPINLLDRAWDNCYQSLSLTPYFCPLTALLLTFLCMYSGSQARKEPNKDSDESRIAEMVESQFHGVIDRNVPYPTTEIFLDILSLDLPPDNLSILMIKGYLLAMRWDLENLRSLSDSLCEHPDQAAILKRSPDFAMLYGYYLFWTGNAAESIRFFEHTLASVEFPNSYLRTQAFFHYVLALTSVGKADRASEKLEIELNYAISIDSPASIYLIVAKTIIAYNAGNLYLALSYSSASMKLIDRPEWHHIGKAHAWYGWCHYFRAAIFYQRDEIQECKHSLQWIIERRSQMNPRLYLESLCFLSLVFAIDGEDAYTYLEMASEARRQLDSDVLNNTVDTLAIMLALVTNTPDDRPLNDRDNYGTSPFVILPPLVSAWRYFANGDQASALELTALIRSNAEAARNVPQQIEAYAVEAVIFWTNKHLERAYQCLDQAIGLAEPSDYLRIFLNLLEPMLDLLRHYRSLATGKNLSFAQRILLRAKIHQRTVRHDLNIDKSDILTAREMEVLLLVELAFSTNEIADQLVVSKNTVKKHLGNIYAKLQAKNNRQALARARELGLIP